MNESVTEWNCPACGHEGNETARKCGACHYLKPAADDTVIDLIPAAETLRDEVGQKMVKTVLARGEHHTDDLTEALVGIAMGQQRDWSREAVEALVATLDGCDQTVDQFLESREL